MSNPQEPQEWPVPTWARQFVEAFTQGIGHGFILSFNVRDYAVPGERVKDYIPTMLTDRACVMYDLSQGLHFPDNTHEQEFRRVLGDLLTTEGGSDSQLLASLGLTDSQDQEAIDEVALPQNPAVALDLIGEFLRRCTDAKGEKGTAMAIIDFADVLVPAGDLATMSMAERSMLVGLTSLASDRLVEKAGNPIFLIADNPAGLHPMLRTASHRWVHIELQLPDEEVRTRFADLFLQRVEADPDITVVTDLTAEHIGKMCAGLNLVHMEDIFLRAEHEKVLTAEQVTARKRAILRSEFGDVLELIEPAGGFEVVGGLDHIKGFFMRNVVKPMRTGHRERVPMGVLLTGPPGTGKSIMAEALAAEAGMNCGRLNPARILGPYVGMSERNLEKALTAIEQLAPIIIFIDEIDQSFQRQSGGDSGVNNRIFRRLMEFMSDGKHRGRVVFLAATNRPDLMDAALRRPGRFDRKIPFLIPDDAERAAIAQVMDSKYSLGMGADADLRIIVERTEGWTGAEIEAAAVKAVELISDEDTDAVTAFEEATRRLRPSTQDIEKMTELAIRETNDIDLLPQSWRSKFLDQRR